MSKRLWVPAALFTVVMNLSCSGGIFEKISCRPFTLEEELYWFPADIGDTVTFALPDDTRTAYKVTRMDITHTKGYTADTGCNCSDESGMLLSNGIDSLFFKNYSDYIYDKPATEAEKVVISRGKWQTSLGTLNRSTLATYVLGADTLLDVKQFDAKLDSSFVRRVVMAKGIGIVRVEFKDSTYWNNVDLHPKKSVRLEAFNFKEFVCD